MCNAVGAQFGTLVPVRKRWGVRFCCVFGYARYANAAMVVGGAPRSASPPRLSGAEVSEPALPGDMSPTTLAPPCQSPARNCRPPMSAVPTRLIWMPWSIWNSAYSRPIASVASNFAGIWIATALTYWSAARLAGCWAMPCCSCDVALVLPGCTRWLSRRSHAVAGLGARFCRLRSVVPCGIDAHGFDWKFKLKTRRPSRFTKTQGMCVSIVVAGTTKMAPMRGGIRRSWGPRAEAKMFRHTAAGSATRKCSATAARLVIGLVVFLFERTS